MSAAPGGFMRLGTRLMFSDPLHGTSSHFEWNDAGHLTGRGFIY